MIVKLISWFGMWRGAVVDDENGKYCDICETVIWNQ